LLGRREREGGNEGRGESNTKSEGREGVGGRGGRREGGREAGGTGERREGRERGWTSDLKWTWQQIHTRIYTQTRRRQAREDARER